MDSLDRDISNTIFIFQIGRAKTKILWFEDFGRQPNWELKGHNWSDQKSKNGFFLMPSIWIIELKISNKIEFGWVELILSSFEDLSSVREGEESQEDSLKIRSD